MEINVNVGRIESKMVSVKGNVRESVMENVDVNMLLTIEELKELIFDMEIEDCDGMNEEDQEPLDFSEYESPKYTGRYNRKKQDDFSEIEKMLEKDETDFSEYDRDDIDCEDLLDDEDEIDFSEYESPKYTGRYNRKKQDDFSEIEKMLEKDETDFSEYESVIDPRIIREEGLDNLYHTTRVYNMSNVKLNEKDQEIIRQLRRRGAMCRFINGISFEFYDNDITSLVKYNEMLWVDMCTGVKDKKYILSIRNNVLRAELKTVESSEFKHYSARSYLSIDRI